VFAVQVTQITYQATFWWFSHIAKQESLIAKQCRDLSCITTDWCPVAVILEQASRWLNQVRSL